MDEKTTQKQESTPDILSVVELIFNLTKEDIVQSAKSIISKFGIIHPISFNIIIVQIIHRSITIRMNEIDLYLSFLRKIKSFESNIFDMYVRFLLKDDTHESFYILDKMIQQNLIQSEIIKNKNQQYFVHYMTEEEFHQLKGYSYRQEVQEILENYEELSKNDWELHKKLIEEGANPNEIAKIIRNDELGKLQEISSQANFNIDQKIEPSLYERCSFINQNKVSLINFAAFFGSVKCFKYLLMNGAKMKITGKYAIAGGNLEIIHLCEQNHVSFYKAYETAIEFYKNDIFIYLYENKIEKIDNLESLGNLCIKFWNIEIFKFLLKNGMKINEDFIYDAASDGNLYLVEHFLKECPIPKYILIFSAESGNIELVEYALKQKGIGINDKNIYSFSLKFI